MPVESLTLETIKDLDNGRIEAAFAQKLRTIVKDCQDRPGDAKPRVLNLVVNVTPVQATSGEYDGMRVEFQVKTTLPPMVSKTFSMDTDQRGTSMLFNRDSPDNVDQGTLLPD